VKTRPTARRDAGMVTAETAVLLPVLVVVLAAAVFVLACVAAQLECVDAARSAARAAARGESASTVTRTAERTGPDGARVVVGAGPGLGDAATVQVVVQAQVRPFGRALRVLPAVRVSGRAVAAVEPGAP
jgi:glucokinase